MEEATAMEVEEPKSKKFGLKNSIQTNFGNDYVFQIVPKDDWSSMAVSLSTKAVKLYSPATGQFQGECKGHSDTINQISFSVSSSSSSPHVLHSCSSDGTIRAWDTRTFQQDQVQENITRNRAPGWDRTALVSNRTDDRTRSGD
ncbi:hypothetical protein OIU76_017671 [Salix suchowensis]|nr:hypothetical protein OIU76_017671 [Salix suchowensis]